MDSAKDIRRGRDGAIEFLESATGCHLRLVYVIIDGKKHPPFNKKQMLSVQSPQCVSGYDGCNHLSVMPYYHHPRFDFSEHPFWPFMWIGTMMSCREIDEHGNMVGVGDREFNEAMGEVCGYARHGVEHWLYWGEDAQHALVFRPIPGDLQGTMWELCKWPSRVSADREHIPSIEFASSTKLFVYDGYDWHRAWYHLDDEENFTVEDIERMGEKSPCEGIPYPLGPHFITWLRSAERFGVHHNNLYLYTGFTSLGFKFIGY